MVLDIEKENLRHLEGWQGFVRLLIGSLVGCVIVLGGMALFLL